LLVEHSLAVVEAPTLQSVTSGCEPPIIRWIASFARMQSIRQSVQDGQFLCRLAQKASDLSVASHADKGIERFLVYVVATALAIDQTPTLRLIEPPNDGGAGQAHIGSHH
jgi:anti-sigma factor ChrR (cupin superfamily)